jgi:hypothetical protein
MLIALYMSPYRLYRLQWLESESVLVWLVRFSTTVPETIK